MDSLTLQVLVLHRFEAPGFDWFINLCNFPSQQEQTQKWNQIHLLLHLITEGLHLQAAKQLPGTLTQLFHKL